jgi:outer membrane receptor protein involved in Fe transport
MAVLLLCFFSGFSQTIKGRALDAGTGEPLVGASVKLGGTAYSTLVKLDGSFTLSKIPAGEYHVSISYLGYTNNSSETIVKIAANETKSLQFYMTPAAKELASVTINGGSLNDRDQNGRRLEKMADPVLNVLSAKTLQLLPDITVANALQRVSGVTIEKSSSGEGRYPIIRGMEKRYINTLVNGIKIPSPDNKNRFIPLDLFPSELLERLEVSKSLTPSMEGDAIGGTINLVMKDAPSALLVQANLAMGFSSILNNQSYQKFSAGSISKSSPNEMHGASYTSVPSDFSVAHLNYTARKAPVNSTMGLTIGNRFGKDKKFGFIVSGSYQDIFRGTNSTFFLPDAQPALNNTPQFVDLTGRKYSSESKRLGLNAKLDFQINKHNKIALFNTFVRLDDYQSRYISDTIALNSLVDEKYRSTWQYQSIYNSTLQGQHSVTSSFNIDWSLAYSLANNHVPDQAEFVHEHPIVITQIAGDNLQSLSHVWTHNSDKDIAGYLNATKTAKVLGKRIDIKLGGLVRKKTRDNFYNSYSLKPQLTAGSSNQTYTDINSAVWIFNPASSGMPSPTGNNYNFTETVTAGYVQGKLQLSSKLEALGGLRIEHTQQHYDTQLGTEVAARNGTIYYTDLLPSIQFKYQINKSQSVRAAYYKALARPGFAELIPDGPAEYETFPQKGNPQGLNHTTSDNIDLRYEFFPGKADQVLLGVFYKNINDPIEVAAVKTGATAQTLIPTNFGTATNFGFEAVIAKYFGNIGVSANYTYTQSEITTSKLYSYRDASGQITSRTQSETRPLQGQSKHIGNLSLIYKNPKIGFDIQAALVYTGERVALVSPYYGLDYWQAPTTQLDLSFEKRIVKRLSFFGKINNLTNTAYILQLHQSYNDYLKTSGSRALALQTDADHKIIVQKDFYKSTYLFGIRFKF